MPTTDATRLVRWISEKQPVVGDFVEFVDADTVKHVPIGAEFRNGILYEMADSAVVRVDGRMVEVMWQLSLL